MLANFQKFQHFHSQVRIGVKLGRRPSTLHVIFPTLLTSLVCLSVFSDEIFSTQISSALAVIVAVFQEQCNQTRGQGLNNDMMRANRQTLLAPSLYANTHQDM